MKGRVRLKDHYPKKILIVQRRMTRYRVPLFERMQQVLLEQGCALRVVYGKTTSDDFSKKDEGVLPWGEEIPCNYWEVGARRLVWQPIPSDIVADQDLVIIPHENQSLYNYWLLARRFFSGSRVAFWGHGANFQATHRKSLNERWKAWTATKVDWWFAYTPLSVERVVAAGFGKDRITCLNNAVDTRQMMRWRESVGREELVWLKNELGIASDSVGIFLGSLYPHKRIEFLLAACQQIRLRLPDFELLIVGDGPQREIVKEFVSAHDWCHWVGAKHDREKMRYLSLAKVVLNPGLVGLGILDSFVAGVPLITTDCGIHSPEVAYLRSGQNGIMTDDNVGIFADEAVLFLCDAERQERMARECVADSSRYTIEAMAENFCDGILKALEQVQRK